MEGWIKLHRKIVDNPYYFSESFTRSQAWVDLLILANHKDNFYFLRGVKVDVKRGQIGMALENLAKRWKWSRGKAERFISELETATQIVRQKGNVTTLLTVVNYSIYQEEKNVNSKADSKADSKTDSKADGQQTVKQTDINKNVNNDKNEKNDKNLKKEYSDSVNDFLPEEKETAFTEIINANLTTEEKIEVMPWPTFDDFWMGYDKKVGDKSKLMKKFNELSQRDKEKIMEHIPDYLLSTPDKQYRKDPSSYLNQKAWNNEIINQSKTPTQNAREQKQQLIDIAYKIHGQKPDEDDF